MSHYCTQRVFMWCITVIQCLLCVLTVICINYSCTNNVQLHMYNLTETYFAFVIYCDVLVHVSFNLEEHVFISSNSWILISITIVFIGTQITFTHLNSIYVSLCLQYAIRFWFEISVHPFWHRWCVSKGYNYKAKQKCFLLRMFTLKLQCTFAFFRLISGN